MPDPHTNNTLHREVSASIAEFRHGLQRAFPAEFATAAAQGDPLRVDADGATMEIALSEAAPRTIALLSLPTLHVTIRFVAGSPAQQQALLARMDRAMQRGGG